MIRPQTEAAVCRQMRNADALATEAGLIITVADASHDSARLFSLYTRNPTPVHVRQFSRLAELQEFLSGLLYAKTYPSG